MSLFEILLNCSIAVAEARERSIAALARGRAQGQYMHFARNNSSVDEAQAIALAFREINQLPRHPEFIAEPWESIAIDLHITKLNPLSGRIIANQLYGKLLEHLRYIDGPCVFQPTFEILDNPVHLSSVVRLRACANKVSHLKALEDSMPTQRVVRELGTLGIPTEEVSSVKDGEVISFKADSFGNFQSDEFIDHVKRHAMPSFERSALDFMWDGEPTSTVSSSKLLVEADSVRVFQHHSGVVEMRVKVAVS